MKILSLNCQRGEQPLLEAFLPQMLITQTYDFLLLQEVNKKVLTFLQNPTYKILRPFNQEAEQDSELCIVYKSKYNLINEGFKSFSSIKKTPVLGFKHPSFGMLWADFEIDGKTTRFVTTHLHAGINPKARIAEVRLAKKILLAESPVWRTILAGDFNTGFPGEQTQMTHALAPEFIWSTKEIGPTLNSRYSEKTANLPNRIATLLNKFNIGIQLQTDHVFVNQQTKKDNHIECSKLSDRVSDHSPVEFIINTIT